MHDAQQSDAGVVAMKAANKGEQFPAEPLERRAAAERNPRSTGTVRTRVGVRCHPEPSGYGSLRNSQANWWRGWV